MQRVTGTILICTVLFLKRLSILLLNEMIKNNRMNKCLVQIILKTKSQPSPQTL